MHQKQTGTSLFSAIKLIAESGDEIQFRKSPRNADGVTMFEHQGSIDCRVQEATDASYQVLHITLTPVKSVTLHVACETPVLVLAYNLMDEVQIAVPRCSQNMAFQYQYGLFYLPSFQYEIKLKEKKSYSFFLAGFTVDYLHKWEVPRYFPAFFDHITNARVAELKSPRLASMEMIEVIDNFFTSRREFAVKMYREARVLELLHLFIRDKTDPATCNYPVADKDVHKLQKVRKHILLNLFKKITVRSLTERFGITSTKLNDLFKRLNGSDIGNFIVRERMRYARKLLIETQLPVETILKQIAYKKEDRFNRDFQKHIGVAPNTLRPPYNFFLASFEKTDGD